MSDHEENIKALLLGKRVVEIELFDSDLKYYSDDMEHTWVVDGGIQIRLSDNWFSFCFQRSNDFFNVVTQPITDAVDFKIKKLGAMDVAEIKALAGKEITDIKTRWNYYSELNEEAEPVGEPVYIPVEIILTFNNTSILQMAAVSYEIIDDHFGGFSYDSENDLLVSVNRLMEIKGE